MLRDVIIETMPAAGRDLGITLLVRTIWSASEGMTRWRLGSSGCLLTLIIHIGVQLELAWVCGLEPGEMLPRLNPSGSS